LLRCAAKDQKDRPAGRWTAKWTHGITHRARGSARASPGHAGSRACARTRAARGPDSQARAAGRSSRC
jgi:hypothetical protein